MVSGTSFATTVAVGRAAGAEALGLYALGFSIIVFANAIQTALITDPVTYGDRRAGEGRPHPDGRNIRLMWFALALAASVVVLIAIGLLPDLRTVGLIVAAIVPFTLARDFARRFAFAHERFGVALRLDTAAALVQITGLGLLAWSGRLTAVSAHLALGTACAAAFGLVALRERAALSGETRTLRETLRAHWLQGRWLVGGYALNQADAWAIYWMLLFLADPEAIGILVVCALPVAFLSPLLQAAGNYLGPTISRIAHKDQGALSARVVGSSAQLGLVAMPLMAAAALAGPGALAMAFPDLDILGHSTVVQLLALVAFLDVLDESPSHALRALGHTRGDLVANLIGTGSALVGAALLIPGHGLTGACLSAAAGTAIAVVGHWLLFFRATTDAACLRSRTPVQHLPRFRKARAEMAHLAGREMWSRRQVSRYQLDAINRIWAKARLQVPYYRALSEERELPGHFESLEEYSALVPVLHKRTVRADRARFLAPHPAPGNWEYTSGSTGNPTAIYWPLRDQRRALRARYRFYQSVGIELFDPTVFLWGRREDASSLWKAPMVRARQAVEDALRNRLRLSAYSLDAETIDRYIGEMQRFGPTALYGFSRAAGMLADRAIETGQTVPTLKTVVLTAEPVPPTLADRVREAFDASVAVEYGSVEFGLIAGGLASDPLRIREDQVFVETVPGKDGGLDIVVTALFNHSFPLLRYHIGDQTSRPVEIPSSGFATLRDVAGRSDDYLLSADGKAVHWTAVDAIFEGTFDGSICAYRVHQDQSGGLSVTLAERPGTHVATGSIARRLRALTGRETSIRVVDRMPRAGAGKHRSVTSEIGPVQS